MVLLASQVVEAAITGLSSTLVKRLGVKGLASILAKASIIVAAVAPGSMGSLKVRRKGVAADTPTAIVVGNDERMVGAADAWQTQVKEALQTSSFKSRPMDCALFSICLIGWSVFLNRPCATPVGSDAKF